MTKIHFKIEHIDPLGQGVYKDQNNIYFIPKTLPNESGIAHTVQKKKGVNFARLDSLDNPSPIRQHPLCQHFLQCPGCHFLHCDYASELEFKKASFKKMLQGIKSTLEPIIIAADERLGYRNRIQLHYSKNSKKLGFIDAQKNTIVEVPECLIVEDLIKQKLSELYQNNKWLELVKQEPAEGHLELYNREGSVQISCNARYAHGGFTQVNHQMNLKLVELVQSFYTDRSNTESLLDIFGGSGNLSHQLNLQKTIIDYYTQDPSHKNYVHLDLLEDNCLAKFTRKFAMTRVDHFIVDPPRKGFPSLNEWAKQYNPKTICYVSCHPQTMIRDLKALEGYQASKIFMLDLFPSTFHFEACIFLTKS
jgi:23S rRNA (uracil1939-C5)-methyltransferase